MTQLLTETKPSTARCHVMTAPSGEKNLNTPDSKMQTIYNEESYSLSYSDFGEITEQLFNPSQGLLPIE